MLLLLLTVNDVKLCVDIVVGHYSTLRVPHQHRSKKICAFLGTQPIPPEDPFRNDYGVTAHSNKYLCFYFMIYSGNP